MDTDTLLILGWFMWKLTKVRVTPRNPPISGLAKPPIEHVGKYFHRRQNPRRGDQVPPKQ